MNCVAINLAPMINASRHLRLACERQDVSVDTPDDSSARRANNSTAEVSSWWR